MYVCFEFTHAEIIPICGPGGTTSFKLKSDVNSGSKAGSIFASTNLSTFDFNFGNNYIAKRLSTLYPYSNSSPRYFEVEVRLPTHEKKECGGAFENTI